MTLDDLREDIRSEDHPNLGQEMNKQLIHR